MKELAGDNWGVAGETVAVRRQREKIRVLLQYLEKCGHKNGHGSNP